MRKNLHLPLMLLVATLFFSCKEDKPGGAPRVTSVDLPETAYMADSVQCTVTVAPGGYPMSMVSIAVWYGETQIAEQIIPTNDGGNKHAVFYMPFAKNAADGPIELRVMARDMDFNYEITSKAIQIVRPQFAQLTLKTQYGDFPMTPVEGKPYEYAVTHAFPTQQLNGIIAAPAFGERGNSFYFGGQEVRAGAAPTDSILFVTDTPLGQAYTVSFNTLSYAIAPFVMPSFDGAEFPAFKDDQAVVEKELKQNAAVAIRGFLDLADWWIDPTFFDKNDDGTFAFRAMEGKYRVTADRKLKYFRVEPMSGNALADFDPATKTGGIWVCGGKGSQGEGQIGIPSLTANPCQWDPQKNFAMAPLGNGIYQVKLVADRTLFMANVSGNRVALAFYAGSRSKANNLPVSLVQTLYGNPGVPASSGGSARFEYHAGHADSNGNMINSGSNRSLGRGRTYVFTLDTNYSPAQVAISLE